MLKLKYFSHMIQRADLLEKSLIMGKIEGRRRMWWQRDEMVGWHHQFNRHEFEQAPGDGDGQGSLVCCSPWGRKESDTTEWLSWTDSWKGRLKINKIRGLKLTLRIDYLTLLSKGLSRVFSNTTVQKYQFFGASFLYSSTLTCIHDYWKNNSFD